MVNAQRVAELLLVLTPSRSPPLPPHISQLGRDWRKAAWFFWMRIVAHSIYIYIYIARHIKAKTFIWQQKGRNICIAQSKETHPFYAIKSCLRSTPSSLLPYVHLPYRWRMFIISNYYCCLITIPRAFVLNEVPRRLYIIFLSLSPRSNCDEWKYILKIKKNKTNVLRFIDIIIIYIGASNPTDS